MQQDVAPPQLVEDVCGVAAQVQRLGCEGRELQIRSCHFARKKHQPRQIDRPRAAEDLIFVDLEVHPQPVDDLCIRAGLDLQPHRVALAAVVQFHADCLQQRARFFLLEVEVRIAGHAESRMRQNFVPAIHPAQVLGDQILQKDVVRGAVGGGQAHKSRQRAWHSHHAKHLWAGALALAPEQQGQAQRLVQYAWKRMRRIDRDRC